MEVASKAARLSPTSPEAMMANAKAVGRLHRFEEAFEWLVRADATGARPAAVAAERAGLLQAVGRYEEALAIRRDAVAIGQDGRLARLGALAALLDEVGEEDEADRTFADAVASDDSVSPFAIASVLFQRAVGAMRRRSLRKASQDLRRILELVPRHAPARGHLAEVMVAEGAASEALILLAPLLASSDDPEYRGVQAEALLALGREDEASAAVAMASAAFEALMRRHSHAFLDHAASFFMGVGNRPEYALALAGRNAELRATPRAQALLAKARAVVGSRTDKMLA